MSTVSDIASAVRAVRHGSPVPLVSRSAGAFGGIFGGRDRARELGTMESVGQIFQIVDGIASFGAGLDWHLQRAPRPGADPLEKPKEVLSHPALDLWEHPNPFYGRREIVEVGLQHLNLVGECWWVIARDPRSPLPLEIWPVRPDRMEPIPSAKDFLIGYIYTSPDGEKVPLELDEVIFERRPNPLDPYRGLGAIQSVLVDIDASKYTAEWNRNFFLNSAEPGGFIMYDKKIAREEEFLRLQQRWSQQHQGVSKAHRVAILDDGQKWVDRKYTQRDMQFTELRKANDDVIRRAFRWPSALSGDSGDINRATAEAHEYMAGKWIIDPQMARIRDGLTRLTEMFYGSGEKTDVEWTTESAVPDDQEAANAERNSQTQSWAALVSAGADPVWAAEVVGLPEPPEYTPPAPASPFPPREGDGGEDPPEDRYRSRSRRYRNRVVTCPGCGYEHA